MDASRLLRRATVVKLARGGKASRELLQLRPIEGPGVPGAADL